MNETFGSWPEQLVDGVLRGSARKQSQGVSLIERESCQVVPLPPFEQFAQPGCMPNIFISS